MLNKKTVDTWFNVRHPKVEDLAKFEKIADLAKKLVKTIDKLAPDCADKSAAFRKIREAVLTAFDAVCLNGK